MKKEFEKVLEKYIWESVMGSGAQQKCWLNIRIFITKNCGRNSPLIFAIDLLHHPHMSYRKRLFKQKKSSLVNFGTFEFWEMAGEANVAKDLHENEKRGLFIPSVYFYDLKSFFLDLMLLKFFLKDPETLFIPESDRSNGTITFKKIGLTLMISREEGIILVNLEKGDRKFFEDLRRGLHLPMQKLDRFVIKKIKSLCNFTI